MSEVPVQVGTQRAAGDVRVEVRSNGPYVFHGVAELVQQTIVGDAHGKSVEYRAGEHYPLEETTLVCRCGLSGRKPYCDGSHREAARHGVDLTETATHRPELASSEAIEGPDRFLSDDEKLCAYARFCDQGRGVWTEVQEPGPEARERVVDMAHHCPSGRLLIWDKESRSPIETPEPPTAGLIEDPIAGASGPIALRGGIPVVGGDGRGYEVRNRQTLCRCGASSNKPFCDGSHASVHFDDGLAASPASNR